MEWHRSVTQYRSSGKNPRKTVGTRFMTPLGIFERMSEQEPYVIRSPLSMQEMPMVEARNNEWLPYCCMVLYGVQFIIPCAAQNHAGVGKPFIIPCAAQNHAGVGKPFIIPCAAQNHAGVGKPFIILCAAQNHAGVGKPFIIPCAAQNHAGVGKPFIIPCAAQN